jgi:hypothetical protein
MNTQTMDFVDQQTGEIIPVDAPIEYEWSPLVNELFAALAKAQAEIGNAEKDAVNPAFQTGGRRGAYATLASTRDAGRAALSANGIAVIQVPYNDGGNIGLATILGHSSGQWMKGKLSLKPMRFDAQGAGSVITYLRRYMLAAMTGVAPEDDDDGNAAVGRPQPDAPPPRQAAAQGRPAAASSGAAPAASPPKQATTPAPNTATQHPKYAEAVEFFKTMKQIVASAPHVLALDTTLEDHGFDASFVLPPLANSKAALLLEVAPEAGYKALREMVAKRRTKLQMQPLPATQDFSQETAP